MPFGHLLATAGICSSLVDFRWARKLAQRGTHHDSVLCDPVSIAPTTSSFSDISRFLFLLEIVFHPCHTAGGLPVRPGGSSRRRGGAQGLLSRRGPRGAGGGRRQQQAGRE